MRSQVRFWYRFWLALGALLLTLLLGGQPLLAQDHVATAESRAAPVILDGETLFYIDVATGGYAKAERAAIVSGRVQHFAQHRAIPLDALVVKDNPLTETTDILAGRTVLMAVSDADARALGVRRQVLAERSKRTVAAAVEEFRAARHPQRIALGVLYTILSVLGLILSILLINRLVRATKRILHVWEGTRIGSLSLFGTEMLPADRVVDAICEGLKLMQLVAVLLLVGVFANLVLSFFPWTRGAAQRLFGYGLGAVQALWQAFVAYLPNLFFIALIVLVTVYILRFLKFFFTEVRRGRLAIPNFSPQWAQPTYVIVRLLVLFFAATVVYPYLPGADTAAFKGISIFVGALFTLGSSSAIANLVSGVVLVYSRGYEVGDRVQISEATGDVIEKSLFVTRIRTIKNVVITIPNAMVLGSHIINYTMGSGSEKTLAPLILNTTVTLGYDTPWRKIHETLIEAAQATKNILDQPEPFVLQTSLNDFYVSYELNAYTDKPKLMARIYSELHQNIQDQCFAAGIEILSPHYRAVRDGNTLAVPSDYYPEDYQAPGFRLTSLNSLNSLNSPQANGDRPRQADPTQPTEAE